MAKRQYSDHEKAEALAALAANAGDLTATSRQTKIPRKTLENWAKGVGVNSDVAIIGEVKKKDLADRLEELAHCLLDDMTRSEKIQETKLRDQGVVVGITIEKMRLLREQATSISGATELTDDEIIARLQNLAERAERAEVANGHSQSEAGSAGSGLANGSALSAPAVGALPRPSNNGV